MRLIILFSVFLVQMAHAMSSTPSENYKYIDFKVKSCAPRETGVSFWFSTEDKRTRHFALSDRDKSVVISFSGGKGAVPWNDIDRFIYNQLNDDEGYITLIFRKGIRFLSIKKYKEVEFGVMSKKCWDILLENVSDEIATELVEVIDESRLN